MKIRTELIIIVILVVLIMVCLVVIFNSFLRINIISGPIKITKAWITTGVDTEGNPLPPPQKISSRENRLIVCVVNIKAPKPIYIGVRWYFEDNLIYEQQALVETWRGFSIQPENGNAFPEGNYRVDIYMYGKKTKEVKFSVGP